MASTVIEAFDVFLRDTVNLEPTDTRNARSSRNWLLGQIQELPRRHSDFPHLYSDIDIHFGSFARNTKIRPLDDLDLIVGMMGLGTTYEDGAGGEVRLYVPEGIALRGLCFDNSNILNSRRVINKFVKHLSDVPQYRAAEIKRNEAAAVLNLVSYPWSFDIVPGFHTNPESDGRTYYIIPNGDGHWMKTDPRVDRERVKAVNQASDGNVLNVVRIAKYWNRRATMPTMPSYMLECIVLGYYETTGRKAAGFVDLEAAGLFDHIASAVFGHVPDPKGIQGDLNTLDWEARAAISARASEDQGRAIIARELEEAKDYRASIGRWRDIFGPEFPSYG